MKSYYYFVRRPSGFSRKDVVYKVYAGKEREEQVLLALVQEYCKDCGLYFQVVSDVSDNTVRMLARSIFGSSIFALNMMRMKTISIGECYSRIVSDCWSDIEDSMIESTAFFHHLDCYGVRFNNSSSLFKRKKSCPPVQRKNLSQDNQEQLQVAMIGFGLILAVFLIAAKIENAMMGVMPAWF